MKTNKYKMVVEVENGWITKALNKLYNCNECKWFDEQEVCNKHGMFVMNPAEFYCADGERRDDA